MTAISGGGLVLGSVPRALPTLFAHDPLHRAPCDIMVLTAKPDPQLARPQRLDEPTSLLVVPCRGDDLDQLGITQLTTGRSLGDPLVIGRRADRHTMLRQHGTHGLDTPPEPAPAIGAGHLVVLVCGDEPDHRLPGRSSSAPKKIAAAFKISLARRNSAISLRSVLFSSAICEVTPGRWPVSTSERRIQVRSVSGVPIPNMPATAVIAAHCDEYCGRTSATMRTARSRSSSGYLLTRPITQILPRSGVSGNAGTGQASGGDEVIIRFMDMSESTGTRRSTRLTHYTWRH